MLCNAMLGVLQYTILLFAILTAEIITVTFLAVLRDKVTPMVFLLITCTIILNLFYSYNICRTFDRTKNHPNGRKKYSSVQKLVSARSTGSGEKVKV